MLCCTVWSSSRYFPWIPLHCWNFRADVWVAVDVAVEIVYVWVAVDVVVEVVDVWVAVAVVMEVVSQSQRASSLWCLSALPQKKMPLAAGVLSLSARLGLLLTLFLLLPCLVQQDQSAWFLLRSVAAISFRWR